MTRSHPIIALDSRRRHSHYTDFHNAKQRFELDVYYTGLRNAERRANLKSEKQRIDAMLAHKMGQGVDEAFLRERRKVLAAQIGNSLGHM